MRRAEFTEPYQQVALSNVHNNMVTIGSKIVLEVLAKAFQNQIMPDLTDNLIELYKSSDEACIAFTRDLVRDNV